MATHSSILIWKILWTEEAGGLWSVGSQSQTQMSMHTYVLRRKNRLISVLGFII